MKINSEVSSDCFSFISFLLDTKGQTVYLCHDSSWGWTFFLLWQKGMVAMNADTRCVKMSMKKNTNDLDIKKNDFFIQKSRRKWVFNSRSFITWRWFVYSIVQISLSKSRLFFSLPKPIIQTGRLFIDLLSHHQWGVAILAELTNNNVKKPYITSTRVTFELEAFWSDICTKFTCFLDWVYVLYSACIMFYRECFFPYFFDRSVSHRIILAGWK